MTHTHTHTHTHTPGLSLTGIVRLTVTRAVNAGNACTDLAVSL